MSRGGEFAATPTRKNSAADRVDSRSMNANEDREYARAEGKRRTLVGRRREGAASGPGPGLYLAPPLFVASDSIVFSLFFSLSLGSLRFFFLSFSPSLSGHRVVSMIPSSGNRGRGKGRRVACSLVFALTSFRDVSIDFISRAVASRRYRVGFFFSFFPPHVHFPPPRRHP